MPFQQKRLSPIITKLPKMSARMRGCCRKNRTKKREPIQAATGTSQRSLAKGSVSAATARQTNAQAGFGAEASATAEAEYFS